MLTSLSDKRKETRHSIPIEITIEVFDRDGKVSETENTVTENISSHGATVFTTLNLEVGRFLRLTSQQYNTSVLAVVRDRGTGADHIPRLHLQFAAGELPI
jgi:hypothetical protein